VNCNFGGKKDKKEKPIFDSVVQLSRRVAVQIPYLPIVFCLTKIKIKTSKRILFPNGISEAVLCIRGLFSFQKDF